MDPIEALWKPLLEQYPLVSALLLSGYMFIRHQTRKDQVFLDYIKQRDEANQRREREWTAALHTIGQGCHDHSDELTKQFLDAQARLIEVVDKSTTLLARVEKALDERGRAA